MFKKAIKSFFSVLVLTSLVLGITLTVKGISDLNEKKIISLASKIGMEGQVAGLFSKRPVKDLVAQVTSAVNLGATPVNNIENKKEIVFKIAIIADSENDFDDLNKALERIKTLDVYEVVHLGDLTEWGDIGSMTKIKEYLDNSKLNYVVIPGDHDLAESVGNKDVTGLANFIQVYGNNYHILNTNGMKIVILDNSANYTPISNTLVSWFKTQVTNADFVMLSQPLYHPTNSRTMGVVDTQPTPLVVDQALLLLDMIRKSNVKAIIAADQHISSENVDPVRGDLQHIVVGALIRTRNLQTPRFSLLTVYSDKSFTTEDVIL